MRKLSQQLEEMHNRIAETSSHEETLLKALSEALTRLDEQLLADVQAIASDHEVRRTAILGELHGLASSIGMFQIQRPAVAARDEEAEPGHYIPSAGDWREAMSNIGEETGVPGEEHPAPRALFPHEKRRAVGMPLSLMERRRRAAGA